MITKVRIALRLSNFVLFILRINVCLLEIPAQRAETVAPKASRKETLVVRQGEAKVIDDISGEFNSFLGTYAKSAVTYLPRSITIGRGLGQGRGIVTGRDGLQVLFTESQPLLVVVPGFTGVVPVAQGEAEEIKNSRDPDKEKTVEESTQSPWKD